MNTMIYKISNLLLKNGNIVFRTLLMILTTYMVFYMQIEVFGIKPDMSLYVINGAVLIPSFLMAMHVVAIKSEVSQY